MYCGFEMGIDVGLVQWHWVRRQGWMCIVGYFGLMNFERGFVFDAGDIRCVDV